MDNDLSPPLPYVPTAPLTAIMQAIAAGLDVSRIFTIVAQQAEQVLAHDGLAVLLRPSARDATNADGADDAHELAFAFCNPPIVEVGRSWPFSDFSFGPTLLANQPAVVTDFAATADQYAGDQLLLEHIGRAGVIVPIAAAPHVLGGLVLISGTPGLHGPEDVLLVEPIANLLAVALEHRRLDERARALAVVEERNRLARGSTTHWLSRSLALLSISNPSNPTEPGAAESKPMFWPKLRHWHVARSRRPGAPSWACTQRPCSISRCVTPWPLSYQDLRNGLP